MDRANMHGPGAAYGQMPMHGQGPAYGHMPAQGQGVYYSSPTHWGGDVTSMHQANEVARLRMAVELQQEEIENLQGIRHGMGAPRPGVPHDLYSLEAENCRLATEVATLRANGAPGFLQHGLPAHGVHPAMGADMALANMEQQLHAQTAAIQHFRAGGHAVGVGSYLQHGLLPHGVAHPAMGAMGAMGAGAGHGAQMAQQGLQLQQHGSQMHTKGVDLQQAGAQLQQQAAQLHGHNPQVRRPHLATSEITVLPCVWTCRDRSPEKDSRFPVKRSKSGPDKSKHIVV